MKAHQVIDKWLQTSQQAGAGQASSQFPKGTPILPGAALQREPPLSPVAVGAMTPISSPRSTVKQHNTATPSFLMPRNRDSNNISAPGLLATPHNTNNQPTTAPSHHHSATPTAYPRGLNPEAPSFISNLTLHTASSHQEARKYSTALQAYARCC